MREQKLWVRKGGWLVEKKDTKQMYNMQRSRDSERDRDKDRNWSQNFLKVSRA